MFTSKRLVEDDTYTREKLREMFDIKDATINTGVFRPSGYQSIWLFVTENKRTGIPQYKDQLHKNTLYWDGETEERTDQLNWDGQMEGRTDQLIIDHEAKGLEILIFYRINRLSFPNYGFKYEGRFRYMTHMGSHPTHFIFQRVVDISSNNYGPIMKGANSSSLLKETKALNLIYCYSRKDKALRDELDKHLSVLKRLYNVISWHDREIDPGVEWAKEIDARLSVANIILLLISSDFMASDYCYGVEMQHAIMRHKRGDAKVIPIILRPISSWQDTPIGQLQALPTDGIPVVDRKWYMLDYALEDVANGIKGVINNKV